MEDYIEVQVTGTLTGMEPDNMLNVIKSMKKLWFSASKEEFMPAFIEMTLTSEKQWTVLSMADRDCITIEGKYQPCDKVLFRLVCIVCTEDIHEVKHLMKHAVEDIGAEFTLNSGCCNSKENCCHSHSETD